MRSVSKALRGCVVLPPVLHQQLATWPRLRMQCPYQRPLCWCYCAEPVPGWCHQRSCRCQHSCTPKKAFPAWGHTCHVMPLALLSQALRPGVTSAIAAASHAVADVQLTHGDIITVGSLNLACLATPGHTNGCMCFYLPGVGDRVGMVFTGGLMWWWWRGGGNSCGGVVSKQVARSAVCQGVVLGMCE